MKKTASAIDRFTSRMHSAHSLLCVGLDPDIRLIPKDLQHDKRPLYTFNERIIRATADVACAFKPNLAFYEAYGVDGITQLFDTCEFLHKNYPDIPIILDAKRADIDSTNTGTVTFAFDYLGVDAITINPYLGRQAIQPFLDRKDKVSIVLCHTSNPGAGEFQELEVVKKGDSQRVPLYQHVAAVVAREWNGNGNCMLVVGATYPKELAEVRAITGEMMFLVPGVGTQGGELEASLRMGNNVSGTGIIMNVSRAIASGGTAESIRENARAFAEKIRAVQSM